MSAELTDVSLMPFGEHKGKLMQNVPVNYLHWLWTHGMSQETKPVAEYIRSNLNALKKENPDLIWD